MFVARELARQAERAEIQHEIVVVEARDQYCGLASANCAGILSTKGMPEVWEPIWQKSKQFWEGLVHDSESRDQVRFSSEKPFLVRIPRKNVFPISDTSTPFKMLCSLSILLSRFEICADYFAYCSAG